MSRTSSEILDALESPLYWRGITNDDLKLHGFPTWPLMCARDECPAVARPGDHFCGRHGKRFKSKRVLRDRYLVFLLTGKAFVHTPPPRVRKALAEAFLRVGAQSDTPVPNLALLAALRLTETPSDNDLLSRRLMDQASWWDE